MVKIRLARHGSKGKAYYRIVVIDEKRRRSGKALDIIGFWDPINNKKDIDKDKLKLWQKKGAKITKAVSDLF